MSPDQLLQKTSQLFPSFQKATLDPIYQGGSNRSFYRIKKDAENSLIAISYNLERPENGHYAAHALFLKKQGIHAPDILHFSPEEGLLWLQDLGTSDLWSQRHASWEIRGPLYKKVLHEAAKLHSIPLTLVEASDITLQPPFDETLYQWEQDYFQEHALGGLWGIDPLERKNLMSHPFFDQLASSLAKLPRQLIHRDFQSQNIILFEEKAWLIDFQGMRAGLAEYDLASLLCDPYVSLTSEEREELLSFYEEERKVQGFLIEETSFKKIFWSCATQRLMQALGAYGFLGLTLGKKQFLDHVTPALKNLREALTHLDASEELKEVLERIPSQS